MLKKLLLLLASAIFFVIPQSVHAFTPRTIITVSNPVRGWEGWILTEQTPLDLPQFQLEEASRSGLPVTWLLRYDAVTDATISAYFSGLTATNSAQFLGAFLEITPKLASDANVGYPRGSSSLDANRVFLSGYSQPDRLKLIDTYMGKFFDRFGSYPKSVSAWHIDSFSLDYLQKKYSVLTAMNRDEQFSSDNYRLWGGFLGSPYYPDKNNSLVPASSFKNRVNLAMVRWAPRDFYNAYGAGSASAYSGQINDYLGLGLNTVYLKNLLSVYSQHDFNEFTYMNFGLENNYDISLYRKEITAVYKTLVTNKNLYGIRFTDLASFGDWFKANYPESTPAYFYRSTDPAGKGTGEAFWYQTPYYRIGFKTENGQTKIIDLRVYNRGIYEDYLVTPNHQSKLYLDIPAAIDTVKFPGTEVPLDIDLSSFKTTYDRQWDLWQISLEKGDQKITFYPKSITFSNISVPETNYSDVRVSHRKTDTIWNTDPYTPFRDKLNYSWLFWIAVIIILIAIIKKLRRDGFPKPSAHIIVGLICLALILLTVVKSGLVYSFGLGFWGPNGHDAVFHLSLIEKFAQNPFSLDHPQYAGFKLSNYHFVFDFFSGLVIRLFNIPSITYYFRIAPLLIGGFLLFVLNKLLSRWHYSSREKIFAFIFVFLGGSLGFIPKILNGQDIFSGESAFWANQSASLFLNPPFALSLCFLISFLLVISDDKPLTFGKLLKLAILGGLLSQTKIYAFILLSAGLFFSRRFKILAGVVLVGTLISLPLSSFSGSPFVFDPLWFSRSLFASYDRFYWPKFVEAWQSYEATGNIPKLLAVSLFSTVIFFLGNLGVRVVGLSGLKNIKSQEISIKIVSWIILTGLLIPLFIVQKVNPWNTIQFTYYSIFFLGLFTGKIVYQLISSVKSIFLKIIVAVILLSLGTATSIGTLKDYLGRFSASTVSYSEMAGLETLRSHPAGLVLTPAYLYSGWNDAPKPLYDYVSTAYVSAFSGQPEFLSDTINLDITGFNYKERSREIQRFYNTADRVWAKNFLAENNIRYVYETPLQTLKIAPANLSLSPIFDSGGIKIYQFN